MSDINPEDMGAGMSAFVVAFFGGGLIVGGFLMSFLFTPAALILFVLGTLFLFASPVVGFLAWRGQKMDLE